MPRDRYATRAAILASAAELVAAQGVEAVGVNALAQAAGCDKVLIYRYFGGLDGVWAALGEERMVWPRVELEGGNGSGGHDGDLSLADAVESVVLEEWAALGGGALMLRAESAELAAMIRWAERWGSSGWIAMRRSSRRCGIGIAFRRTSTSRRCSRS